MNIEESKSLLGWVSLNKLYIDTHNECDYHNIHIAIETILNFIEKQQKEIKNLVNENNDLHKEINRRIKLKIENEKIVDNEFISKNKIREKIKRLDYSRDNTEQRYFKKEVLQELLNENHIPHVD